ncbi:hypothetical protein IX53_02385 [Kosmotoga pacifica]|uniref:TNase-like domain-containing protein n=1 Tax=Kosmotoga pacifica TaxID=1330330 RepID=A0A0G2ZHC5_9BACT|nr:hypothetical protein IX53_02385 [Kosmotoga pacifica]
MKRGPYLIVSLLAILFVLGACSLYLTGATVSVLSITDGDTIRILYDYDRDGYPENIPLRYIGVDTPELHENSKPMGEFGEEAYQFNKQLIEDSGYVIRIEPHGFDSFGRILAFLYTENGKFINEELIRNGLARPLTYENTAQHSMDFKEAYYEAYNNRRGIFSLYDTAPVVDASEVRNDLKSFVDGGYLGKIIWLKFYVTDASKYILEGNDAIVEIRKEEANLFFDGDPEFESYLHKTVKVFGEIWENKEDGKPKILLRAPFELKIIN